MVWNLQALWITFTLLSSLIIFTSNHSGNLEIYDYIGIITWISGLFIEVVADKQKSDFKNDISNKNKFISTGLWKYSRHPNYLGEIIEWLGFYIMTLSFPAFIFVIWTMANLIPRSLSNHAWYKNNFPNYPKERKAIIPFML